MPNLSIAPAAHRALLSGVLVAATLWSPVGAAAGAPEDYRFDPVHTRVLFAVSHAGFSQAMGAVSGSTGTLSFDRDDWRSARLDVRVPLERLDLGDAKWNAAVLAANLLDGKRHPEAHFVSSSVEPVDADHARVCGDMTIRGVTKPLCMDVTLNALKRHPLPPFRRTAGFSATATLSRADFGITAWKDVIGDSVELRIEAEAVRGHGNDTAPQETTPAPDSDTPTEATPANPPEPPPTATDTPA